MLEHPAAAKFRSHIMTGEWSKVRIANLVMILLSFDSFLLFFYMLCCFINFNHICHKVISVDIKN